MTNKANVWERMIKSRNREEICLFYALKCHQLSKVQVGAQGYVFFCKYFFIFRPRRILGTIHWLLARTAELWQKENQGFVFATDKKIADVQSTGETKDLPSPVQLQDSQPLALCGLFSAASDHPSRPLCPTKAGIESQTTDTPRGTNMVVLSATEGTASSRAARGYSRI